MPEQPTNPASWRCAFGLHRWWRAKIGPPMLDGLRQTGIVCERCGKTEPWDFVF